MKMNLSQLKNIDLKDALKSIKLRGVQIDAGLSRALLLCLIGFVLFIAYLYFIFFPGLSERELMRQKVDSIPNLESRLKFLETADVKSREELVLAEKSYEELNRLFSVESELEELYQKLSQMAASQGLVISSLAKDGEEAIYQGGKQMPLQSGGSAPPVVNPPGNGQSAQSGKPAPAPLFYRIKLKVELTGNYSRYMRYRELLAGFEKSVNIDKEQITLIPGDSHGLVQVKAQLSTFRLPQKLVLKAQSSSGTLQQLVWRNAPGRFIKVADTNQSAKSKSNEEVVTDSGLGVRQTDRDPFSRSSSGMIEGGRDPRISPLIMANPQSYVITGVIVSNTVKAAMIRTDFRENYVVRVGDRLGNQGGIIVDIDMDGIVLRQPSGRIRLYLPSQAGQSSGLDAMKPSSTGPGGAR